MRHADRAGVLSATGRQNRAMERMRPSQGTLIGLLITLQMLPRAIAFRTVSIGALAECRTSTFRCGLSPGSWPGATTSHLMPRPDMAHTSWSNWAASLHRQHRDVARSLYLPEGWDLSPQQPGPGVNVSYGASGLPKLSASVAQRLKRLQKPKSTPCVKLWSPFGLSSALKRDGYVNRQAVFCLISLCFGMIGASKGIPCIPHLIQLALLNASVDAVATVCRYAFNQHVQEYHRKLQRLETSMAENECAIIGPKAYAALSREYNRPGHKCEYIGNGKWACI